MSASLCCDKFAIRIFVHVHVEIAAFDYSEMKAQEPMHARARAASGAYKGSVVYACVQKRETYKWIWATKRQTRLRRATVYHRESIRVEKRN